MERWVSIDLPSRFLIVSSGAAIERERQLEQLVVRQFQMEDTQKCPPRRTLLDTDVAVDVVVDTVSLPPRSNHSSVPTIPSSQVDTRPHLHH